MTKTKDLGNVATVKTKDLLLFQVNLLNLPVGIERGAREFLSTLHKIYDRKDDPKNLSDHEKWILEFLELRSGDLWSPVPKFDISEKGDW
jgi:hypothetical protein